MAAGYIRLTSIIRPDVSEGLRPSLRRMTIRITTRFPSGRRKTPLIAIATAVGGNAGVSRFAA